MSVEYFVIIKVFLIFLVVLDCKSVILMEINIIGILLRIFDYNCLKVLVFF